MLRNSIAVDLGKGKGEKRRGGEGAEEEMRRYEGSSGREDREKR